MSGNKSASPSRGQNIFRRRRPLQRARHIAKRLWMSSMQSAAFVEFHHRARLLSNVIQQLSGRSAHNLKAGFTVAFAVTSNRANTAAGDYFTARELGEALERRFGWHVRYLPMGPAWYDCDGVDAVIAMRDDYDPTRIRAPHPVLSIGWIRAWFHRWLERPGFHAFDILTASSDSGATLVAERSQRPVSVLRIATNPMRFLPGDAVAGFQSDVVFTGNYWAAPRDVADALAHSGIDARTAVYGKGWEAVEGMRDIHRGFVPYTTIPSVYASTKIVIDDAAHVTKPYGSVNCRVYDALASGRLALSNCQIGIAELFGSQLPTWTSAEELQHLVSHFLDFPEEREDLTRRLRDEVLTAHTYDHRAAELLEILHLHISANSARVQRPFTAA